MTLISLINVIFGWPQAWGLWHTHDVAAVSALSMWLLLIVQWGFSINAWARRDWFVHVSSGLAGICTVAILVRIYGVQLGWF